MKQPRRACGAHGTRNHRYHGPFRQILSMVELARHDAPPAELTRCLRFKRAAPLVDSEFRSLDRV